MNKLFLSLILACALAPTATAQETETVDGAECSEALIYSKAKYFVNDKPVTTLTYETVLEMGLYSPDDWRDLKDSIPEMKRISGLSKKPKIVKQEIRLYVK